MLRCAETGDRRSPKGGQSREDITVINPRKRRWKCEQCDETSIQEKEDLDDEPTSHFLFRFFLSFLFVSNLYIYYFSPVLSVWYG